HLSGASSFKRWDWVTYEWREPTRDRRPESCHVFEDTLMVDGSVKKSERSGLLSPYISPSVSVAADAGKSLAIINPKNTRFSAKPKKPDQVAKEKSAFQDAAKQLGMFDEELAAIEPTPYEFRFAFDDESGKHNYQNGDWEAHTMFWKRRKEGKSDKEILAWMDDVFNVQYKEAGMLFAVGNMASRPQTWQLLGVLRVAESEQTFLF
ncbi:MAG: hypothetical protein AAFO77_07665, partial [Pseudomonadota bacterium]